MSITSDHILRPALIGTLVAWITLVVASGAFAAVAFPAVRDLAPLVPSMPVMTESHWKVVAGMPAQANFRLVQAVGWVLGLASMLLALGCQGSKGLGAAAQWISHAAAIGLLLANQLAVMDPLDRLGSELHAAMRRGDLEAAMELDRQFSTIHRLATPMMSAMLVAIALVTIIVFLRARRLVRDDGGSAS